MIWAKLFHFYESSSSFPWVSFGAAKSTAPTISQTLGICVDLVIWTTDASHWEHLSSKRWGLAANGLLLAEAWHRRVGGGA